LLSDSAKIKTANLRFHHMWLHLQSMALSWLGH